MTSPHVLHELGGPDVAWTRGNTAEALPGISTALSWSFFGTACERGMRRGFVNLGAMRRDEEPVPDDVGERFNAIVHGRYAGNIDLIARMAERLPGVGPEKMEQQLFGEIRDVERHPTRRRYPVVAVRMPVEVATAPARLRRVRSHTFAWWSETVPRHVEGGPATPAEAREAIAVAADLFARNMALHTTVSMIGSGVFEQLEALVATAPGDHSASALVTGYGSVEETEIAHDLWRVSRDEIPLDAFLRRHGWQGPDAGQIHRKVWRENPAAVERLVETYRGMPETRSPESLAQRQRASRQAAEAALLAALPRAGRLHARALLALASRWIGAREIGKAGYLIAVDGARAAAGTLARDLVAAGRLTDADDAVHLTIDELCAPPPGADLEALVARRRAEREELVGLEIPEAWIGAPEPIAVSADAATDDEPFTTLQGIGVNPGVVEGVARVVLDPDEADLEDGEILVCATTDPSWVSLFLPAAAAVIDIGGHMSHGAIVAREMGLPCVINTRTGTRVITTGDRLRVDGSSGVVSLLGDPVAAS